MSRIDVKFNTAGFVTIASAGFSEGGAGEAG